MWKAAWILLLLLAGCTSRSAAVSESPPVPPPPYLLHLPGIGGLRLADQHLLQGLIDGGYHGTIEIFDWTENAPGLGALVSIDRNRRQAQAVADKLIAVRRANPNRVIILTMHSGGSGPGVWALEKLPPDVAVDRVILLASALSPDYDLSLALAHVRGRMFHFYSRLDSLVLGRGATYFGTIDGVKTSGAGYVGFRVPPHADPKQYAKLRQIPYDDAWESLGNNGGHMGTLSRNFAMQILAPLVTNSTLSGERD